LALAIASSDVLSDVAPGRGYIIDTIRYTPQLLIRAGNLGFLNYMAQEVARMRDRHRAEGEIERKA
jgi:hypothetical protein